MYYLKFKKLSDRAVLPTKAHKGDAGLDLYSLDPVRLGPNCRELISTGIAMELPDGFAGFIQPRSGLANKNAITVLNSPGLIDSGYRGEIKVNLINHDMFHYHELEAGSRIAQLVIMPVVNAVPQEVEELNETDRGENGHGSSGD